MNSKYGLSVGDIVTFHTIGGGGMGGCKIMKITSRGIHYTQDEGKHIKTVSYERITEVEKQGEHHD